MTRALRHAWLCSLLLSMALPFTVAAQGAVPGQAGILKQVQGEVRLVNANGESRPARSGDVLSLHDSIRTPADAGASAVLRDGTTLVVGPSSQVDLKQYRFDATTHEGGMLVSLLRGSLRMITGLLGKAHPEAVKVETTSATVGIRGTDFIVEADPSQ